MFELHTHSNYSDGVNTPEEMIEKAIELNYSALGISDHFTANGDGTKSFVDAMDFQELYSYFNKINSLKEIYKDKINILASVEMDYLPDGFHTCLKELKKHNPDYILCSIHNGSKELNAWGIKEYNVEVMSEFVKRGIECAATGKIDILGHFDSFGTRFNEIDEKPFYKLYDELAEALKDTNTALEYNSTIRPIIGNDKYMWEKCREYDIPVIVNSDAHKTDILSHKFKEVFEFLDEIGVRYFKLSDINK